MVCNPQLPVAIRVAREESAGEEGRLVDLDRGKNRVGAGFLVPPECCAHLRGFGEWVGADAPMARVADCRSGQHPTAAPGHVHQRPVVGVGGQVEERGAACLIKAPVGEQTRLVALQLPVHVVTDLRFHPCNGPEADLVDLAVVEAIGIVRIRRKGRGSADSCVPKDEIRYRRAVHQHAVDVELDAVVLLPGHGEMLPFATLRACRGGVVPRLVGELDTGVDLVAANGQVELAVVAVVDDDVMVRGIDHVRADPRLARDGCRR